ncbi:MAG: hypothetical protein KGH64_02785 [Candidatus Micrarchaeota archaeon]|nr:hypothetical protein [Candidatus Micrarchaeota archaeon]MDE1859542.1 hypothetical protein [Candidatus Micrarchaeota archaeon]
MRCSYSILIYAIFLFGMVNAVASSSANCFLSPGSCGYPDPAYGNVGVPPGIVLTPALGSAISTPYTTISGLDIIGALEVNANNVTISDTRVTLPPPGCGTQYVTTSICGAWVLVIESGAVGTVIENTELDNYPNVAVQDAVRDYSPGPTLMNKVYTHGTCSGWIGSQIDIEDSYLLADVKNGTTPCIVGIHLENTYDGGSYSSSTKLIFNHNTLLNPLGQTSTIFSKTDFSDLYTLTITNNLLAGGGYTLYGGGAGTGGSIKGPVTVAGNRFARCLSSSCPDQHGYYPKSGYYGLAAYFNNTVTKWSGNYWDDSPNQTICESGSNGCS